MNPDELRALADALEPMSKAPRFEDFDVPAFCAWVRACADAQPVAWIGPSKPEPHVGDYRQLRQDYEASGGYGWRRATAEDNGYLPLYTYPQPAEPKREPRPCTCHPDDNPPVPCAQKYALNECRATRSGPDEAQIEARDALLDFISENGTASEGVQHYLDRYVRAALAAKDEK